MSEDGPIKQLIKIVPQVVCGTIVNYAQKTTFDNDLDDFRNDQLVIGLVVDEVELTLSEDKDNILITLEKSLTVPITTIQTTTGTELKPTKTDLTLITGILQTCLNIQSLLHFQL